MILMITRRRKCMFQNLITVWLILISSFPDQSPNLLQVFLFNIPPPFSFGFLRFSDCALAKASLCPFACFMVLNSIKLSREKEDEETRGYTCLVFHASTCRERVPRRDRDADHRDADGIMLEKFVICRGGRRSWTGDVCKTLSCVFLPLTTRVVAYW